ncbi:hypothetical protein SISNIDRAFT_154928 [Sistotremastrum niveocremeum HHB9708]|uniref:Uncharacterized protein n=1 Tax=Sistotremastrum niveocremeum HHB9708 TaxID=1314777 RepID=A0A165A8V5_9AGAM|nr:hypothetical protein SISNIDRAFT_154928 [Sistotremastrum niveocremeum HHB9708]
MDISPQADGALSSEDGSGLHTPTSAYTKLPPININTSFQPFDQDQPHSFPHRHHLDNPYHSAYLAEPTPLLQPQHTQPCLPSFPSLSPSFTFPPFVVPGALPMYSQYDQSAQLPPIQSSNYAHQSSQQASLPPLAPPPAPLPPVQSSSNPVIVAKREPSPSPPPATTPMPVASTEPGSVRADSGPDPGPSSSTAQKAPSRVKDASGQVIACKQCS